MGRHRTYWASWLIKNTDIPIRKHRLYRTADGHKVRIYAIDGDSLTQYDPKSIHGAFYSQYSGWLSWTWRPDGTWRGYSSPKYRVHTPDEWDIVGYWKTKTPHKTKQNSRSKTTVNRCGSREYSRANTHTPNTHKGNRAGAVGNTPTQ